ncbi:MAG: aminotransferase class IV [Tetrasphaera sp.]|nr:aminotransferase class IV [Tetrasphaera sp.]
MRVWVNGRLTNADTASVSAVDHGVTVGDGGFETAKIVGGIPYAVTRHLARLDRTLDGLGLPLVSHDLLREGIEAVLTCGPPIEFGRLRWTVTGGYGPLGSDRHDSEVTVIVTAAPQARPAATGEVVLTEWVRNERSATAGLKTTSYAENVVALAYAKERGAVEALFANTRGDLCEGTGSNVFVVVDGVLLTPPVSSGCLPGIARELTLEWCREAGLPVAEEDLPVGVLGSADEVFLTSSIKDVMAVTRVGERRLAAGEVTSAVRELYGRRLGEVVDP